VHPKGKSMSQEMIDRRALLHFAAAEFPYRTIAKALGADSQLRVAS
jgi:hypothetical protein